MNSNDKISFIEQEQLNSTVFDVTARGMLTTNKTEAGIWIAYPSTVNGEYVMVENVRSGASIKATLYSVENKTSSKHFIISKELADHFNMKVSDTGIFRVVAIRETIVLKKNW